MHTYLCIKLSRIKWTIDINTAFLVYCFALSAYLSSFSGRHCHMEGLVEALYLCISVNGDSACRREITDDYIAALVMLDAYLRRYSPCDWPCSPCRRTHSSVASSARPLQPLPLLHTPLPFTTESCLRSVGCFSRVASSESCCIWIFRGDGLLL